MRVVGVGASAGGLDALKPLVGALADDVELSVVVLQHLPPDQHGLLAELLRVTTSLSVTELDGTTALAPNTVLVVPAGTCVRLLNGVLTAQVVESAVHSRTPIDLLFQSIAEVLRDRATGVVLSGTASDGIEGLRAIREAGGTTIAQQPSTARFDQMPRSAISAGVVDRVLSPAQIGSELAGGSRSPRSRQCVGSTEAIRDADLMLLARYGPPCVVVDDNLDIVQVRGNAGLFLEYPPGPPQRNLLRMVRDGLVAGVRVAIDQSRSSSASARQQGMQVIDRERLVEVDVEVIPIEAHFVVIFEARDDRSPSEDDELERLRVELATTRSFLERRAAQQQATGERLSLANEELQATNEELQSTNEELHTAKEELQATNNELAALVEELQRGNAMLREVNDDLVNVLASVEIAIIFVDTQHRIRRFTPAAREVMNLFPADVGRPIGDLAPAIDVVELDARIAEVIETLEVHEAEVTQDGGRSYRMQIRPYRTLDHRIGGAVIACVEITTLRAARDHARAVVEAIPAPLAVLDDRLRIVSANRAVRVAFDRGDLTGHSLLELGNWGSDLGARLDDVVFRGAALDDLELVLRRPDGDRIFQLAARALPSIEAAPKLVVGLSDVTERRAVERLRAAAQLERDSFLDAISHELRAPLGVILLWARVLRDLDHADPRRLQGLDTITDAVQTQSRHVDDLLELSLARTTQLSVSPVRLDPAAVVRDAVKMMMPAAVAKQIAIELRLEAGLAVLADPRRLDQIASKLLANAITFTPAGGAVTVTLSGDGGLVCLAIQDTGPGIPANLLDRMFEPFSRADTSIARRHAGLGIGLSLVRNLVERHGGTIEAARPERGGTLVTVRLRAG